MYNLISTIKELPTMVGCQEFPNSPQGMALIKLIQDFINEEYHYSGETVRKAFMMAAKQELYLDGKRIDASTFGQHLSVNVVGRVLTAYKEHQRQNKSRPGYNPMQLPEVKKKPITPQEAHEMIVEWINRDRKLPFAAPYHLAYQYLLEKNMVRPAPVISYNRFKKVDDMELKIAQDWYQKNCLH